MPQAEQRYEPDDVVVRTARWWGAYLFGFLVLSVATGVGLYVVLSGSAFDGHRLPSAGPSVPGRPLLQDNRMVRTDIADLRRQEQDALDHAGPSLVHPGRRRIPIEEAIGRIARSGLPTPAGTPAPPPEPLPHLPEGGQL